MIGTRFQSRLKAFIKIALYNILETKLSNYFNGDIVVDDIVFCFRDNLFFPCGISARVDNI